MCIRRMQGNKKKIMNKSVLSILCAAYVKFVLFVVCAVMFKKF